MSYLHLMWDVTLHCHWHEQYPVGLKLSFPNSFICWTKEKKAYAKCLTVHDMFLWYRLTLCDSVDKNYVFKKCEKETIETWQR